MWTVSIKATVILQPSWAQIYRGETVTARCEIQGGGGTQWMYEWRPARLNIPPTSSEHRVTDSGEYSCRGRRDQFYLTQWSDVITITVSCKLDIFHPCEHCECVRFIKKSKNTSSSNSYLHGIKWSCYVFTLMIKELKSSILTDCLLSKWSDNHKKCPVHYFMRDRKSTGKLYPSKSTFTSNITMNRCCWSKTTQRCSS